VTGDPAPPGPAESGQPALVLPTVIVFPGLMAGLLVREQALASAVEAAVVRNVPVALFRAGEGEGIDGAAEIGVSARIARLMRLPAGPIQLFLQGVARVRRRAVARREPFAEVGVETIHPPQVPVVGNPLREAVINSLRAVTAASPTISDEVVLMAANATDAGELADVVAAVIELPPEQRQRVLESIDPIPRLELALELCEERRRYLEVSQQIREQVGARAGRQQREALLREQLRAIQRELGELDPQQAEMDALRRELRAKDLPEEVRREVDRELSRLTAINPASPEYAIVRTRLDWIQHLPWADPPPDRIDLDQARSVLDEDHYGLDRIKDRIIDYLAVAKLRGGIRGPILGLVGPPGVGKTSLGQSIARAMDRPFVRASLGGIRDEADIRGHRRTYVGALPGRIIQGMRRAESRNPVFMLDEVDKLGAGFQGDPSAALLEVLDPAQNRAFVDSYLDVPFDLSRVFFICTANVLDTIPAPLVDRMEVIQLAGYTDQEKREIARRHLLPKQMEEHGLPDGAVLLDEEVLTVLISGWTREAGVRQLDRQLAAVCRKVARARASGDESPVRVTVEMLTEWLGPPRLEDDALLEDEAVGAATGLAWTPVGGDVLTVEASVVPGSGQLTLTGQLGGVMQESARAAITYARSRAGDLGLPADFFGTHDLHIHVPAGAVPKDGPSAGVTLATALISAATRRPVDRRWAMTGEVTLRGLVLPVGGIKDKVLAADRVGLRGVILPRRNERDLTDVPADVRERLEWRLVDRVDQVLEVVLGPHSRPAAAQALA
jgi:ATP-dependent Lon protease